MRLIFTLVLNLKATLLKAIFFCTVLLLIQNIFAQAPVINSFSPASAHAGATVTITGTGFNATPENNTVFFGGAQATVLTASATTLTVAVPGSATYKPISVNNGGLTGYSSLPFLLTFGNGSISSPLYGQKIVYDKEAGYTPQNTQLADIDGDGKLDILNGGGGIFSNGAERLAVTLNTSTPGNISLGATSIYISSSDFIFAQDFNGDGKPDILCGSNVFLAIFKNSSTPGNIVLDNTGFFTPTDGGGNDYSRRVSFAVGDIDGDGLPDIIGQYSNFVVVYKNTSSGANISFDQRGVPFAAPVIILGEGEIYPTLAVADLDNDGKPDIIVGNPTAAYFNVMRNTSSPGSISFQQFNGFPAGGSQTGVYPADVDGDGKIDLVFSCAGSGLVSIAKNTTTGSAISFAANFNAFAPWYINQLAFGDANGDGKPDIQYGVLAAHSGFLINTGSPDEFAFAGQDYDQSAFSFSIGNGDLDGDGKPDVASVIGTALGTKLVLNRNKTGAPGITGFSPAATGRDSLVVITGFNFDTSTRVSFGNTPAAGVTVQDANTIIAKVGAGESGTIYISSNGAIEDSAQGFTFVQPPVLLSFTPTSAGLDSTVTITGSNFTSPAIVTFGGTPAQSVTVVDEHTINVVVAQGASGMVKVNTPGGRDSATGFTWLAIPTITSFTPAATGNDSVVTIKGTNFYGTPAVTFGGIPALLVIVADSTTIQATVGTGASGDITVTNTDGVAVKPGFSWREQPAITSFTPTTLGADGTVTIIGSGFYSPATVTFGGVPVQSVTVVNDTTITAVLGAGATGNITVNTPGGAATATGFTWDETPVITSFTPEISKIPGDVITIKGLNFYSPATVKFGGVDAVTVTVVNPTTIAATTGSGATGLVTVTTNFGTAQSTDTLAWHDVPVITSFTPTETGVNRIVTITGNNFYQPAAVTFGGRPAFSVIVVDQHSIQARVGPGQSGPIAVTTPSGTVTAPGFIFDVQPTITSFSPASAGFDSVVTITGRNFTTNSSTPAMVQFGAALPVLATLVNSTTVTARVPEGQSFLSGVVEVITPGGTGTSSSIFHFLAAPTITSVTPTASGIHGTVTITGTGFGSPATVKFGGTPATSATVVNSGTIVATVAAGTSGIVQVNVPGGQATLDGFSFLQPSATISGDTALCLNSTSPNITFTGENGEEPYTFGYTVNGIPQTITTTAGNLITLPAPTTSAGTFVYSLVSVTDNTGNLQAQDASATVTVKQPTTSTTTVTVCSNALPYQWNNQDYSGAGTYTFDTINAVGCDSTATLVLSVKTVTTAATLSTANNRVCLGGVQRITVTATGGVTPYMYSIDGGATWQKGVNFLVAAGTYSALAKDTGGCAVTTNAITITQPDADITITAAPYTATCGNNTIIVNATGGFGGYGYRLNSGIYQAGNVLSNAIAGTNEVRVQDANGCTIKKNVVIHALAVTATLREPLTCYGTKKTIHATATYGTAPYQYSIDGTLYQDSGAFTLPAGTYNVTIKDAAGCTAVTNAVTITQPAAALRFDAATEMITCDINRISLNATGGFGGYRYRLNGSDYQSSGTFNSLGYGTYKADVKDANGCSSTKTLVVTHLTATATARETQTCYNVKKTIHAIAANGTAPYRYSIDGTHYQDSGAFTVPAGTYTITVKDAAGCTAISNALNITQPAQPLTVSMQQVNVSCKGGSDGSITLNATGGYGGYRYSISGAAFNNSNAFTGLGAGFNWVRTKDANDCITTTNVTITQPSTPCATLSATKTNTGTSAIAAGIELHVQVQPNPSANDFVLTFTGGDDKAEAEIKVTDMFGKTVYQTSGPVHEAYKFGHQLAAGMYVAQILNGNAVKTVKLIKGN